MNVRPRRPTAHCSIAIIRRRKTPPTRFAGTRKARRLTPWTSSARLSSARRIGQPVATRRAEDRRALPLLEDSGGSSANYRACVLKCGRAIAVMQSRENLYERQPFTVDLPRWVSGLRAQREAGGIRLAWQSDPAALSYRVWKRIEGARVYPEWELVKDGLLANSCSLPGTES